jgi:sugar (pentulose or hexulose) kinase
MGTQAAERGPAGVITYALLGLGERFPFIAQAAETFTLGEPSDEIEKYAALLEGVAFIERLCFDYLDMLGAPIDGPLVLTGGGAKRATFSRSDPAFSGRPCKSSHARWRRPAPGGNASCLRSA